MKVRIVRNGRGSVPYFKAENFGVFMKKVILIGLLGMIQGLKADPLVKTPEKLATCVACHGDQGRSSNPVWPHLAGQHQKYLLKRLSDYKANKTGKPNPMTAIAALLSEKDIQELAAWYASKPRLSGETARVYLKRGEQIYRGGDFDKKISACIACHGPKGRGNGEAGFPEVSGQNALYLVSQLEAFKEKNRQDDLNAIMRDIAGRMSKEDMTAVAHYMQGLY